MLKLLSLLIIFSLMRSASFAQDTTKIKQMPGPPIPIEIMAGDKLLDFQVVVNRHFTSTSKFSFITVTSYAADYKNDLNKLDLVSNASVGYDLFKNVQLAYGISLVDKQGINQTLGLTYFKVSPKLLIVLSPTVALFTSPNVQGSGLIEYKPKISRVFGLYTRVQGLYVYDAKNKSDARSYLDLRLGLAYEYLAMGIGSNFDYYGSTKSTVNNYGIFIRSEFR